MSRNTISHPGLRQQTPARWADLNKQATARRRLCPSFLQPDRCRLETRVWPSHSGQLTDHPNQQLSTSQLRQHA
jgi:hypothetical protein